MPIRSLVPLLLALSLSGPVGAQVTAELDAYWSELSRTVAEGDTEAMAALYHPDAVLVSLASGESKPISQAVVEWDAQMVEVREGRAGARVEFRFTRRLHDASTAHETGIFQYVLHPRGGEPTVATVHFEALLVKTDDGWRMVMEFQKEPATDAEWSSAGGGSP